MAETWAHYFHIVDALDTADAFGLSTHPETEASALALTTTFDSYRAINARVLLDAWVPLTIAINSINRSMGQRDLYPFVLSAPVLGKLQYIHDIIHAAPAGWSPGNRRKQGRSAPPKGTYIGQRR